jgi:hypothetical protein
MQPLLGDGLQVGETGPEVVERSKSAMSGKIFSGVVLMLTARSTRKASGQVAALARTTPTTSSKSAIMMPNSLSIGPSGCALGCGMSRFAG